MSIDMSGSDGGSVDYSSFEYQQMVAQLELRESGDSTGGSNPRAQAVVNFEPLGDIGGLDQNEIAELAYLETHAVMEIEDESDDQNVATTAEQRGTVGLNLPSDGPGASVSPDSTAGTDVPGDVVQVKQIDESNVEAFGRDRAEDRIMQVFKSSAALPFDDQTNGPGGAGSHDHFYATKQ